MGGRYSIKEEEYGNFVPMRPEILQRSVHLIVCPESLNLSVAWIVLGSKVAEAEKGSGRSQDFKRRALAKFLPLQELSAATENFHQLQVLPVRKLV